MKNSETSSSSGYLTRLKVIISLLNLLPSTKKIAVRMRPHLLRPAKNKKARAEEISKVPEKRSTVTFQRESPKAKRNQRRALKTLITPMGIRKRRLTTKALIRKKMTRRQRKTTDRTNMQSQVESKVKRRTRSKRGEQAEITKRKSPTKRLS